MNPKTLSIIVTSFAFFLTACEKDGGDDTTSPKGQLVRIQQGTDPDITEDTVWRITYNEAKKISKIVDSLNEEEMLFDYDPAGRLTNITSVDGYTASYQYNDGGLLTRIDYYFAGSNERYAFTYNNGVVEKCTRSSDLGGGPMTMQEYLVYTFTEGNITNIKRYNKNDALIQETNLAYGPQNNPFKELALVNNANLLGVDNFANYEIYFNKNLLSGYTINTQHVNSSFTFSNSQQITKLVTTDDFYNTKYTWLFSYE